MSLGVVSRIMAADEPTESRLLDLYRRFLGEPDRERDVYLGFGLFFGGIALGIIGFGVFLWSTAATGTPAFWVLREIALVTAFLGLPAFILSIVVLLPVSYRARVAAAGGATLCLLAVGLFIAVYPGHWNVQGTADYSAHGIAIYAAGLAILVASTGTALVANYLDRAAPATIRAPDADGAAGSSGNGAESVSEEQVRRDIDEAMESAELTWGGVEKSDTKRLKIDTGDAESQIDRSGFDANQVNTARSESVDDAVSGLRQLQGGERETGTAEGVDDQTAALRELREQQRHQEVAEPDSLTAKARDWLGFG